MYQVDDRSVVLPTNNSDPLNFFHVFSPFFGGSNLKLVGSPDQTSKWKKGVTKQKGICSIRKGCNQIKRQILKLQIGGAPPNLAQTTKKIRTKDTKPFQGSLHDTNPNNVLFSFFGKFLNKKKDIDLPKNLIPTKMGQTFDPKTKPLPPTGSTNWLLTTPQSSSDSGHRFRCFAPLLRCFAVFCGSVMNPMVGTLPETNSQFAPEKIRPLKTAIFRERN